MIGDYLVVALVIGIAVSFVAIIHHFWLRDAFKEEAQKSVPDKNEGTCGISAPRPSPHRQSRGLSQTRVPGLFQSWNQRNKTMNKPTGVQCEHWSSVLL